MKWIFRFYLIFILPVQAGYAQDVIHILMPGQYHDAEFDNNLLHEEWFGIFNSADSCYIKKTSISYTRVYDPVLDPDTINISGDLISIPETEQCILLIAGMDELKPQQINSIKQSNFFLQPGEQIAFDFNQSHYIFSAEGDQADQETKWYNGAYRLYVEETNQFKTKLLIASDTLSSESPFVFYWLGDINGDDQLDMIINTSYHYNLSLITLFLSSGNKNKMMLRRAAQLSTTGC